MKVLSIGNSFSTDAHRYLHCLSKHDGEPITTANLYIGGCPLDRHYNNMLNDNPEYLLEFNGESTCLYLSIKQVLTSQEWDVITLQQASYLSADFSTYTPFIESLASYVRENAPNAKIYIHQTWAYEEGSDKLLNVAKFNTDKEMFENICNAYDNAYKLINADGIIPCGKAMYKGVELGLKVHRDTFHASLGLGRYILALTWYKTLTGKDITKNNFSALDKPVTRKERKLAIKAVNSIFEAKN